MISPRLAEITLERERGHASALVSAEFDHEEAPKDYVSPELDRAAGASRGSEAARSARSEHEGGMPRACPLDRVQGDVGVSGIRASYLLRISALSRRIIARRLSEGRSPVMASIRSPTCMAMA